MMVNDSTSSMLIFWVHYTQSNERLHGVFNFNYFTFYITRTRREKMCAGEII